MKEISVFILMLSLVIGCNEYSTEISQEMGSVKEEPSDFFTQESESSENTEKLFDFSKESNSEWFLVNDDVMGGVSQAQIQRINQSVMSFSGRLSLKNNGGFSSVRSFIPKSALASFDGLTFKIRGDGRLYSVLVTTQDPRISWQSEFETDEEWQTVTIPFDEMRMSVRGWKVENSPKIVGSKVTGIGFIISDKIQEPFNLEIDWIAAHGDSD